MKLTEEELNYFYERVSFSGLLIIYALKLSLEKKLAFDTEDFAKTIQVIDSNYFLGFIVACTSCGIADFNYKGNVVTVVYIDPFIIRSIDDEISSQSKESEYWVKWYKDVKDFFE